MHRPLVQTVSYQYQAPALTYDLSFLGWVQAWQLTGNNRIQLGDDRAGWAVFRAGLPKQKPPKGSPRVQEQGTSPSESRDLQDWQRAA